MNQLSDQLIDERKSKKAPGNYPQRENMSQMRESLNGTLRVCGMFATIDAMDISQAQSGALLLATSQREIKLLEANGSLRETITIPARVK